MKKIIATVALVCVVVAGAFGQTNLLDTNKYFSLFSIKRSADIVDSDYVWAATDEAILSWGSLNWNGKENDDTGLVDTPLEFALLSYYWPAVLKIRPKEADAILPANNPKLADQKLGAAVFQEIQILRFLNDAAAVNRHEGILRYITDRGNATRAEIEKFYRDNVRSLIAAVVDEEFNKVSFSISNNTIRKGYNAVLTRTTNNQYILEYEGVYQGKDFHEKLPATPLDTLLATMRRDTENFDQNCVDTVRAQAALIPAVVYEKNKDTTPTSVKNILTDFYDNPTRANYEKLLDLHRIYRVTNGRPQFEAMYSSFRNILTSLHPALAEKVMREGR